MSNSKKFEVVDIDSYGDEHNYKIMVADSKDELNDVVALVYLEGMKSMMDSYIIEDENGVLVFEKKDYIRGLENCGFMVVNGEGQIWFGDEGGKVVREVKG